MYDEHKTFADILIIQRQNMSQPQDDAKTNGVNGDANDAADGNTAGAVKKNKKGKAKKEQAQAAPMSADQQEKLKKAMELLNMQAEGDFEIFCLTYH